MTDPITRARLAEIKAREQKASKAPWRERVGDHGCAGIDGILPQHHPKFPHLPFFTPEDATFIAHSRSDVPNLAASYERAVELLREAYKSVLSYEATVAIQELIREFDHD